MIYAIKGKLISKNLSSIILENNNIFYEIQTPNLEKFTINESYLLEIHFQWSAEKGPSLFGFESIKEKEFFLLLISAPGIGPKNGIKIMEQLEINTLIDYIYNCKIKDFSQLKGIGEKKAEEICLFLKNKIKKFIEINKINEESISSNKNFKIINDLKNTLEALGYSNFEIIKLIEILNKENIIENNDLNSLIKISLKKLSKI